MDRWLPLIYAITAVGGFVVVCLRIRNHLLKGRNLKREYRNLEEEGSKPGPKVVQHAGGNATYIDKSRHFMR